MSTEQTEYILVWEFLVRDGCQADFEAAYDAQIDGRCETWTEQERSIGAWIALRT